MKVYFISGLAADSRVFKHIHLPAKYEIIHLDWIAPDRNESLASYASRLGKKIITAEPFVLVGLSMGGMIACEIANQHKIKYGDGPALTVILSSVPLSNHLPGYFKLAAFLRLHKLVPAAFLKSASMLNRLFSTDNAADKTILRQVIQDSDPAFIRWAMGAILSWKNDLIPPGFLHIHGTKDRILPIRFTKPGCIIKDGSHLMVMSRAQEINTILAEAFNGIG